MIYTHEVALLRIAELRHLAAAERRAREYDESRRDREARSGDEDRARKWRRTWSAAA